MPTVRDVLAAKGSVVHTIEPESTVLEATQKMNAHKLGALLVVHQGHVVGIFTERDVLRRVVAEQRNPSTCTVAEVMTANVICVSCESDLDEVSAIMKDRRIRHVPVVDRNGVHGMISIGDVNAAYASNQEAQITFLNEYIYGRA